MTISSGNTGDSVRAGIELEGPVLRYAEVEQVDSRFKLVRLGSCEFDFDITDVLLGDGDSEHLDTVGEALHDVFANTRSNILNIAVHPTHCISYVTAIPAGLRKSELERRINDEVSLLAASAELLHTEAEYTWRGPIYDGSDADWLQVVAVSQQAGDRLDGVLPQLVQANYRLSVSTLAAARIVNQMLDSSQEHASKKPTLTIGLYEDFAEFGLSRSGKLIGTHVAPAYSAHDIGYYATALSARYELLPSDIDQVCLYGSRYDQTDLRPLQNVFGPDTIRLNPVAVVSLDPASLTSSFDSEAYVPCIGIAL